jgi:hypothetical protein
LIHARKTVHETLDGETIVIHLETGSYYSLTGSASEIWILLGGGDSVAHISAELARRYEGPADHIRSEVEIFIADLEREGLIEQGEAAYLQPTLPLRNGTTWAPPRLERYDDMRDFLLVDPIHEVDEVGWPSRKTPA